MVSAMTTWLSAFGKVAINEDKNGTAVPVLTAEGNRHGRVLVFDPATGSVEFIAENDTDPNFDDLGKPASSV